MASGTPDMLSEPESKVVFNSPFDSGASHNVRITNKSGTKLAFRTKIQNSRKLTVEPGLGLLSPKQKTFLTIALAPFDPETEQLAEKETLTISYVGIGTEVTKATQGLFTGTVLILHKHINFEYNL